MHIIRKLFPHQRQHGADNGVRLFPTDKQKILAAFSQRDPFSIVDLMGVHDDVTLRSLTEDPGQLHHIKGFGRDQITQNVARTYTRKLVGITHQNQAGSRVHGTKKRVHQVNVYHGHFINNDGIRIQRILLVALKVHAGSIFIVRRNSGQLQKPVNGARLVAGGFCHTLSRTSGRCRQKNLHLLLFKIADDGVDGCCLTGTRAASDDKKAAVDCLNDCPDLKLIRLNLLFLADLLQFFSDFCFRLGTAQVQVVEHAGGIEFCVVILGSVDMAGRRICFLHRRL